MEKLRVQGSGTLTIFQPKLPNLHIIINEDITYPLNQHLEPISQQTQSISTSPLEKYQTVDL